jgi:hypothetical protein
MRRVRALFLDRDGVVNREVGYLHKNFLLRGTEDSCGGEFIGVDSLAEVER